MQGEIWITSGYKPRSRKYPVLCKNKATNKVFKFTQKSVSTAELVNKAAKKKKKKKLKIKGKKVINCNIILTLNTKEI